MYSDLNLILLQAIVELITGLTLDNSLSNFMFRPMELDRIRFNPLLIPGFPIPEDRDCRFGLEQNPNGIILNSTVWEEWDLEWRKLHIHGIVHDENACAIGGVSGHAGIFSSLNNVARFTQMMLFNGSYQDNLGHWKELINPAVVELFTTRQDPRWSRGLGWDTPSENCTCGEYMSNRSFGHLGFTGTMIWADKELNLGIVLLTNRVDPTRFNGTEERIQELRREISNIVTLAVTDMPISIQKRTPT